MREYFVSALGNDANPVPQRQLTIFEEHSLTTE